MKSSVNVLVIQRAFWLNQAPYIRVYIYIYIIYIYIYCELVYLNNIYFSLL